MRCSISSMMFAAVLIFTANALKADTLLNWHLRLTGQTFSLYGVAHGHGQYVAVGYDDVTSNTLLTSPDGINWTARTPPSPTNYLQHIAFGNNVFLMASSMSNWRSTNGTDWTPIDNGSGDGLGSSLRLRFLNGNFWELRGSSGIRRSPDGLDWTTLKTSPYGTNRFYDITHGGDKFVAVGHDAQNNKTLINYSADNGATWHNVPLSHDNRLRSVAYGNGRFIAVGGYGYQHGLVMTSTDGTTWSTVTEAFEYILYRVIFDGELFVIGGDAGTMLVSSDGINWTLQWDDNNQVVGRTIYDLCRGQGKYLGVGYRGTIVQSDTGGAMQLPAPSIQANGAVGTVLVNNQDQLEITVTMNAGDYDRQSVDWWLVAVPGAGDWYYLGPEGQWNSFSPGSFAECRPANAGPLTNITTPLTVLPARDLPPGTYVFYFAVDPMDGILNYPDGPIRSDSVTVIVQ
ncbi:MAG: WD40/YVTN/BNR-like repeat-containing protein [Kiritimatiellia bacterium]